MGVRLLKIAVIYLAIGVGFGMYALVAADFRFTSVDAYANLLGWATLALAGFIYHFFPRTANHVLGKAHFWLHNLGLPIMMVCLFLMILMDNSSLELGVTIGAIITSLGVLAFFFNVLMNVATSKSEK